MKTTRLTSLLALLLALAPPLAAQDAEPFIIVTPHVGVNLNPTALYRVYAQFPLADYLPPHSEATLSSGVSVGADVDVVLWQGAPVRLRLGAREALFATATMEGELEPIDPTLPLETVVYDFDAALTLVTADLVFRPPGDRAVREQFIIGLGLKHYRFGDVSGDTIGFIFPANGGSGTVHLGAAVDVPIGGLTFNIGVHDYINSYGVTETIFSEADSRTQHTVLISVGALFPLGGGVSSASYRGPSPSRR